MSDVERLLAAVRSRVHAFDLGDPAQVLDEEALSEVDRLLRDADPATRFEVVRAAAWLHWCRYLALPADGEQPDLRRAIELFLQVARVDLRALPGPLLRRMLGTDDVADSAPKARTTRDLIRQARRTGDPVVLEEALRQVIEGARDSDPAAAPLADLDEAILVGRETIGVIAHDHPYRSLVIGRLASAIQVRYRRTGLTADLDDAIAFGRMGLPASMSPSSYVIHLANLAGALVHRYDLAGVRADLDEAITLSRRSVAHQPEGHPDAAALWNLLSGALCRRAQRDGDAADLDEAVEMCRRAVAAAAHPAMYLSNLGGQLRLRYARRRSDGDLDESVDVGRRALAAGPTNAPDRAGYLMNLAGALRLHAAGAGGDATLDEAVTLARQAVAATAVESPERADRLTLLGTVLHDRYESSGDDADVGDAVDAWSAARASVTAPAAMRLRAAIRAARAVAERDGPSAAVDAYGAAVGLLPLLAWRGIDPDDQQFLIESHAAGLACDAAASAAGTGAVSVGIELLEQGRAVAWSQMLDLRGDLSSVHRASPDLAERLVVCRRALEQPFHTARGVGR
ncbi:hypothetical protein [Micromonospora sp. WMMD1155]|uniref:hypothetical protein n=1 Tax=Micromonospora sp. WMMD1155 TaxID=3016094 RepID=UPI00249AB0F5|nr:hypothetical protein [Micromonospora sp. WMMD1155]WFE54716.1 hypothetical protein O7617_32120 [Micromonospora sp. WMMD1155]